MTTIPTAPIADALLIPEHLKCGATTYARIRSITDVAEPLLGIDRAGGDPRRAWCHRQGDGWLFVAIDPAATLYHLLTSPLRGRPRYLWLDADGSGVRRGYLTDEAREPAPTGATP